MKNIEIPYEKDRGRRYRFFEMVPGLITWGTLALPFVLSLIDPRLSVLFILGYLMIWFAKSVGLNIRALQGFNMLKEHEKLPWPQMLQELDDGKVEHEDKNVPDWHFENLVRLSEHPAPIRPKDIVHAIIIATWNESREILEPTIQSVLNSDYNMDQVMVFIAYEDRGGPEVEARAKQLVKDYKKHFRHMAAYKHIDQPGEMVGKGGNITWTGREVAKLVEAEGLDPLKVIVTTLDADNRPHKYYLASLSYVYSATPDPLYVSYQPLPIFTNNIWDVPAPMRVIATGNSFWNIVLSMRHHMIRNFSSHAQSLKTLIDTDFWSVRTIVEDGHQFWRTYFRYDGKHEVYPLYVPIYQDAVLSSTYVKTFKAQFVQLRRWAWGASDIAYVLDKGFFTKNKVPKSDLLMKLGRLLEGHISWAVAPFILMFAAFIPGLFNPDDYASRQLPNLASTIQTIAVLGIVTTLFLSLKLLPPKPARYKRTRTVWMMLQWVLLPVTTIGFNAVAALNSQTRLMFGRYLGKFDVTDKAVVTDDNKKVM